MGRTDARPAPPRSRPRRGALALATLPLLLALVACGEEAPAPASDAAPRAPVRNLVLVSIDTLRADRLGCYGYERDTSPNLDAFAARSLRFANATSAANNTTPSHMSMFTGMHAPVHGQWNLELSSGSAELIVLPRTIPMLAERLADAGLATAAFTDGGYLTKELQFDRGFDVFQRDPETVDRKVDRVLEFLASADRGERHFVFVHTYEVHAPYVPPPEHDRFTDPGYAGPWRALLDEQRAQTRRGGVAGAEGFLPKPKDALPADREFLSDLYDGGIRFTDAEIGRLLDVLTSPPWSEDTAVIVLSDHGEAFAEHASFSHHELYQTVTHVPLIVHVPGGPAGVVETNVAGVDVAPTVLDILGLPIPEVCDGTSVLGELDPDRAVLSFRGDPTIGGGTSLRIGDAKVLRNLGRAPWQRFDLAEDPGERAPLPVDDAVLTRIEIETAALVEAARILREGVAAERGELSEDTIASLRALGYIGEDDG